MVAMNTTPEIFTALSVYNAFMKYVQEWQALEREYYSIPSWRWFKQMRNIRQREALTRVYIARMRKYGIIK